MTRPIKRDINDLVTLREVDSAAVGEELEPEDIDKLESIFRDGRPLLARRATIAAGAMAAKLFDGGGGAPERALAIVMAAATDHRYRVRLAAAAASEELPLPQREGVLLELLARADEPDDPERGNYVVQLAVLKSLGSESLGADANGKLRGLVQKLSESSPAASVRDEAARALAAMKPLK